MRYHRLVIPLVLALVVFTGCAIGFSNKALKEINPDVKISDIFDDPYGVNGETILFGGTIMSITSYVGKTSMEIRQLELDPKFVPMLNSRSEGVIVAKFSTFLPQDVYRPGRLITIIGRVTGVEEQRFGPVSHNYPMVDVVEHQLRISPEYIVGPPKNPVPLP